MFLEDFLIGEVFAYSCIDLVQDPELYGTLAVDFDVSGCLYGALEGTSQNGQVLSLFLVLDELVQGNGQCSGISLTVFRQF